MHVYTLTTKAHPDASRALTKGAVAVLKDYIVNEEVLHSLDLLLTEAVANCARHAYRNMEVGNVEIELDIDPGNTVACKVSDWGTGFTKTGTDVANPSLSQPEAEGGRGLYIIASLATEYSLTEENGKNTVHAQLTIPRGLWIR
ncbi:MAG: ATP-binding protein [Halodesulfovibrio sp.]